MIDTYRRLLFTHGYQAASLFCYLVNMADEEGKINLSTRQLTNLTNLSIRQVRQMLQLYQAEHLTEHLAEHLGTIITICNYGAYIGSKEGERNTKRNTSRNTKKNAPLLPPLNVPPTPPSLLPPIIPQENAHTPSACERFAAWLSRECPYIAAHLKPLTDAELDKLKQQFSTEAIMEVCHEMENRKDLRKRYTNLYRTLLNWLKRRNENNRTTNPSTTREERLQQAAQLVYRLGEEANNPIRGLDQLFS